jgi:hypothetical protein
MFLTIEVLEKWQYFYLKIPSITSQKCNLHFFFFFFFGGGGGVVCNFIYLFLNSTFIKKAQEGQKNKNLQRSISSNIE